MLVNATAQQVGERMLELREGHRERTPAEYTMVMIAYSQLRDFGAALDCFEQMKADGTEPDLHAYFKAWQACMRAGEVEHALRLLEELRTTPLRPSKQVFSKMIAGSLPWPGTTSYKRPVAEEAAEAAQATEASTSTVASGEASTLLAEATAAAEAAAAAEVKAGEEAMLVRAVDVTMDLLRDLLAVGKGPTQKAALVMASTMVALDEPSRAVTLIDELRAAGVPPELKLYTKVMHACIYQSGKHTHGQPSGRANLWQRRAFRLHEQMRAEGLMASLDSLVALGHLAKRTHATEAVPKLMDEIVARAATAAGVRPFGVSDDISIISSSGGGGRGGVHVVMDGPPATSIHDDVEEADGAMPSAPRALSAHTDKMIRSALSCLSAHEQWTRVLELYEIMTSTGHSPDRFTYAMTLNACEKVGFTDLALGIFSDMITIDGLTPDVYHFCSIITACGKVGRPYEALDIFEAMVPHFDVPPNRMVYTATIQACADSGLWRKAVDLFMELEADDRVAADASQNSIEHQRVTFNAILDAVAPFTSGRRISVTASAEALTDDELSPPPYEGTTSATAGTPSDLSVIRDEDAASETSPDGVYEQDHQQRQVLAELLWTRALEVGAYGNLETINVRSARFDLHNLSCGASEMAVRWWLRQLRSRLRHSYEGNQSLPNLCLVTGKGKSRPTHQQRDLRESVEELLVALRVPTITAMHDAGRLRDDVIMSRHEGALYLDTAAIAMMARLEVEPEDGVQFARPFGMPDDFL